MNAPRPGCFARILCTGIVCVVVAACGTAAPRASAPGGADADGRRADGSAAPMLPAPEPGTAVYAVDPVHTRIAIAIDHAGFSKAIGTVSGTTGTLHLAPGSWDGARVAVAIPLDQLDFGDAAWNRAVAAGGLLDSARHPRALFRSLRVEPVDAARARLHGELTLRGTTRDVVLEVVRNGEGRYPLPPFRRTAGFSATTTLSRADFGSTAWSSMIGDAVDVRIELEATR